MKLINLYLRNGNKIELHDEDDTDINEYTNKLNQIFNSSDVIELYVNDASVVVRPSSLDSIVVHNVNEIDLIKEDEEVIA